MSTVHIHLILNHIPVLGAIFSFVLLLAALIRRSDELLKASLAGFVIVALIAVPVYLTGESAEEMLESLPGVSEVFLEQHETWALLSVIALGALGLISLVGLALSRRRGMIPRPLIGALVALTLVTCGVVAQTANLGGQIRHAEIRPTFTAAVQADQPHPFSQPESVLRLLPHIEDFD